MPENLASLNWLLWSSALVQDAIQQVDRAEQRIELLEQQVADLTNQLQQEQEKTNSAPKFSSNAPVLWGAQFDFNLHQAELLLMIYEGVDHAIFVLEITEEQDFRFLGWNPAAERIVGIAAAEIVGKTPEQLLPPQEAAAVRQNYQRCLDEGSTITYEEYRVLNGVGRWLLTTLKPLKDAAGKIYWIVGTGIDITELKQTAAALQKSEEQRRLIFD